MLDLLKAAILGIVEGITEWLPISSTGHLILVDEFISLGMSDAFKEMFDVVIQFGAILAVVVLFWGKLWPFCNRRAVRHNGEGAGHYLVRRYCRQDVWLMWFKVLVAVLPAMLVGLPLDDWMTEHLHNPPVVAAMLILYGVLFIVVESSPRRGHHNGFGLERNGGHRVQHAAPHCANGKAQRRGHGGKPVAKRQQALRDAVQHNANGCQNVLQEFQKKHPFLKNRAAPQGSGQLCRKMPLLSRILRNARTIYYNKAFLYGNQGRPPHCGHFPCRTTIDLGQRKKKDEG